MDLAAQLVWGAAQAADDAESAGIAHCSDELRGGVKPGHCWWIVNIRYMAGLPVALAKSKYAARPALDALVSGILGRVRQRLAARTAVRRRRLLAPKPRIRIEFHRL